MLLYRDSICKLNAARKCTRAEVQLDKLAIPRRFTRCISRGRWQMRRLCADVYFQGISAVLCLRGFWTFLPSRPRDVIAWASRWPDQLAQTTPDATDWNKRGCLYRLETWPDVRRRTCSFGPRKLVISPGSMKNTLTHTQGVENHKLPINWNGLFPIFNEPYSSCFLFFFLLFFLSFKLVQSPWEMNARYKSLMVGNSLNNFRSIEQCVVYSACIL